MLPLSVLALTVNVRDIVVDHFFSHDRIDNNQVCVALTNESLMYCEADVTPHAPPQSSVIGGEMAGY